MSASDLFKAGRLAAAIDAQLAEVKAKPADHARRLFLFEMLLFSGDLDRAAKQGDLVKFGEVEIDATMAGYRKLVDIEQARRRVMREGRKPQSFGPLPEVANQRIEALNRLRENRPAEAAEVIAAHAPPLLSGTINGKPFEGLCDCDDILAPVLEVVSVSGYFWVPFADIASLVTNPPKYPRDLYWLPANLELRDGQSGPVFVCVLYPFSHEHADDAVKLGRATDWSGGDGAPARGLGQKTLLAGDDVVGVLDVRELCVNPTA